MTNDDSKRGLSGTKFKTEIDGKDVFVPFEHLPEIQREAIYEVREKEFIVKLLKRFVDVVLELEHLFERVPDSE